MLSWTSEPPTEPGWYWNRQSKIDTPIMTYVSKYGRVFGYYPHLGVDGHAEFLVSVRKSQWAGPIPEPVEKEM